MATRSIFVSHSHADNRICDQYVDRLREQNFDVWYDRTNLHGGRMLSIEIQTELRNRSALLVMVSPASNESYWVPLEVDAYRSLAARDRSRIILPIRIELCDVPLLFQAVKWIDACNMPFDDALNACIRALDSVTHAHGERNMSQSGVDAHPLVSVLTATNIKLTFLERSSSLHVSPDPDTIAFACKRLISNERLDSIPNTASYDRSHSAFSHQRTFTSTYAQFVITLVVVLYQIGFEPIAMSDAPQGCWIEARAPRDWAGVSALVKFEIVDEHTSTTSLTVTCATNGQWADPSKNSSVAQKVMDELTAFLSNTDS